MQLLTIVEEYIFAALRRAEVEETEAGEIVATIPGFPGIIAYGADRHECTAGLLARMSDWVWLHLRSGDDLPTIEAIDLNRDTHAIVSTYSPAKTDPDEGEESEFYGDEHEMNDAFEKHMQLARMGQGSA